MRTKQSFTLIEMMVVMAITAISLGAMAFSISKALQKERFERGVDGVIAKIALAQEVMLDFHTDVKLTLTQQGDKVACQLDVNIPLPIRIARGLNLHPNIAGVTAMALDGIHKEAVELLFDGTVGAIPEGTLTLFGPRKEQNIALHGYPGHIHRGIHESARCQAATYPQEIVSAL